MTIFQQVSKRPAHYLTKRKDTKMFDWELLADQYAEMEKLKEELQLQQQIEDFQEALVETYHPVNRITDVEGNILFDGVVAW